MREIKHLKIYILGILLLFLIFISYFSALFLNHEPIVRVPEIKIAVPLDTEKGDSFLRGVNIALETWNSNEVIFTVEHDTGSFSDSLTLAQSYFDEESVLSVIGHWDVDACESLARIYEREGLPLLVPTVSLYNLVNSESKYVFQNLPDDTEIAMALVDYAIATGLTKGAIYYDESTDSDHMSTIIEEYAFTQGFQIIDKISNLITDVQFSLTKRNWDILGCDVIFVVGDSAMAGEFMYQLRQMDNDIVIISNDIMTPLHVLEECSSKTKGIIGSQVKLNPLEEFRVGNFLNEYAYRYDDDPNFWVYQGYDCVMLMIDALETIDHLTRDEIQKYLSQVVYDKSLFGEISFDENNMVQGKEMGLYYLTQKGEKLISED